MPVRIASAILARPLLGSSVLALALVAAFFSWSLGNRVLTTIFVIVFFEAVLAWLLAICIAAKSFLGAHLKNATVPLAVTFLVSMISIAAAMFLRGEAYVDRNVLAVLTFVAAFSYFVCSWMSADLLVRSEHRTVTPLLAPTVEVFLALMIPILAIWGTKDRVRHLVRA